MSFKRDCSFELKRILAKRIMILDGAMATTIQKQKLSEIDFRGERFAQIDTPQTGNFDLLSITQPKLIFTIHENYLVSGADIITTNTFCSTGISMADYKMENYVFEINKTAAQIARKACDNFLLKTNKKCFVAGSVGPTNRNSSKPRNNEKAVFPLVSFDELRKNYYVQVEALLEGGVDIFLIETVFDILNAKAALIAIEDLFENTGVRIPIMISVTITNHDGLTLSGHSLLEFYQAVSDFDILSIGINCGVGAEHLLPYIQELAQMSKFYLSVHPNAGLPNKSGNYEQSISEWAEIVKAFIDNRYVNIVGGCCGTDDLYVSKISELAETNKIRKLKNKNL